MNPIKNYVDNECESYFSVNEYGVLTIPEGVTELEVNAFRNREDITRVIFPRSLKKIGAYAFYGCTELVAVESPRKVFKYVDDPTETHESETILFGVDAWYQVPWAQAKWGDYYIANDQLFMTFADADCDLIVPEGVRVLKPFSMNHLDVSSILLPDTLERIENFAFFDTKVAQTMCLPEEVTYLDSYALADCTIVWAYHPLIDEIITNMQTEPAETRKRFPVRHDNFNFRLRDRKHFTHDWHIFKRMAVVKNFHLTYPKDFSDMEMVDCSSGSYMLDPASCLGKSMLRRLKCGSVMARLTHDQGHFMGLKIYIRANEGEVLELDVVHVGNDLPIVNDELFYDYIPEGLILSLFDQWNGMITEGKEALYHVNSTVCDEWFWFDQSTFLSHIDCVNTLLADWNSSPRKAY